MQRRSDDVSVPERGFVALIPKLESSVISISCTRFSPRAGIRGFDTPVVAQQPEDCSQGCIVSVPERGFVALILTEVSGTFARISNEEFQSPSGDSWL